MFCFRYRNPELLRLAIGRFLEELLEQLKAGYEGSTPFKVAVYSGMSHVLQEPILFGL